MWISNLIQPGHPGGFLHCHPDLHSGTKSCIICGFRIEVQMGCHRALNERGASVTRFHIPLLGRLRCGTLQSHSAAAATAARQPPILRGRQMPASSVPGMGL
jgi:hypothetical protein